MRMGGFPLYVLGGVWLTLAVALGSLAVALVLGFLGAAAKLSGRRILVVPANIYTTVVRGVPELVLMLLVFYGGQIAINRLAAELGYDGAIDVNPLAAGVITLGFIFGAYLTETFRGAILAVPSGQSEAALALGMRRCTLWRRIVIPQMLRLALPSLTNNWLVLTKATALVSVIGLSDMMYRAKQAGAASHAAFAYFLIAAAVYLMITTVSLIGLRALEKHLESGVRRVGL